MPEPPLLLSTLLSLSLLAPRSDAQSGDERARTLFSTNCASCHGESGDGKGTAELDRPARSFKDGGFSFGNTPEALFRTISVGIPSTPMAGFDSSLSEEERKILAAYVVTLGPPIEEVKVEDTILAVHDRPLFVRGLLPSLGEGLPVRPRGLLIGEPSGITFEYRTDDVRLLALRQGGFVRRTDWTGRGGTALEPLGKVVHLVEGGKPEAMFWQGTAPLVARLGGTAYRKVDSDDDGIDDNEVAMIEYRLTGEAGVLADVLESPSVQSMSFGTGYWRPLFIELTAEAEIVVRTPIYPGARQLDGGSRPEDCEQWQVLERPDGPPVLQILISNDKSDRLRRNERGQLESTLALVRGETAVLSLMEIVLIDWSDQVRSEFQRWYEEDL